MRKRLRTNLWKISTIVLSIVVIALIGGNLGSISTSTVSPAIVSAKALEFINTNLLGGQTTAELSSVEEVNGLYLLNLNIDGQEFESYTTKDGVILFPSGINLDELPQQAPAQTTPVEVPQSSKPVVEVFVMSHCPFGTLIEKGIIPVASLLGDKISFEVKFVYYAMHGMTELDEQLREYCLQKNYPDLYLQYLSKFLEQGNSTEALEVIGLIETDVSDCISETDLLYKVTELYEDPEKTEWVGNYPPFNVHDVENQKYGVGGSPALVINEQILPSNIARDAQSLLNTICAAFTDKPVECDADLSSLGNPAPGFGFDTQGGSASTAGCSN